MKFKLKKLLNIHKNKHRQNIKSQNTNKKQPTTTNKKTTNRQKTIIKRIQQYTT